MTQDQAPPVAIVTGGASGIGAAIAQHLARAGTRVAIADIAADRAEALAEAITADGGTAVGYAADVTARADLTSVFESVEATLGPLQIMVNNAGAGQNGGIRNIDDQTWQRTLAINLNSVFLGSQLATQYMIPRRAGRIINISSRAWLGWYGQFAYAASKGGVVSATRSLAIEVAKYGITVNCIAPGLIETPLLGTLAPEVRERLMAAQPTGTVGSPDDVAWAAGYFVSDGARATTGQVLYVCGGKSIYAQPAG